MVRFTIDSIQQLMAQPQQIRNIAVVAHVDHGKTTLTDSLIQRAGIIPEGAAGTRLVLDHTEEEKQRGITIKSTAISLFFDLPDSGGAHLINLIDSPGHADFSSEVSAALRVTDGAVVVVDCVEGKCVQTVTVLRQALGEGVVPVLVLNKIDRAFLELQLDAAAAAERFAATVDDINAVLADGTADAGDATAAAAATKEPAGRVLSPAEGTVAFAAAVLGCGFTVGTFARKYAAKFGVDATRLAARLWGGHYYDRAARRWTTSSVGADGRPLETGFVQYVAGPVAEMMRLCMAGAQSAAAQAALLARLDQQGVRLSSEERALTGKAMLRVCMRRWLPLSDALLEMVVRHLPSPPSAQAQRAAALCAGAATEATAGAIRACDAGGPVVVFVSKMVPQPGSRSRFVAFGRVFSGTVRAGTVVQVIGADGERHSGVRIRAVLLMMGAGAESLESCPPGNVVGLVGVDECLRRSGTLTTVGDGGAIRVLSFRVSPVVRVAVRPVHAGDAGKVAEALRRLGKSDPLVEVVADTETGELVVCGAGELHLEVVLKELEALAGVPLAAAQPAVSYRETVAGTSSSACLAKSANKLNRVAVVAAPLGEALTAELEACASGSSSQVLAAAHLAAVHGWEGSAARRVWAHTGTTVVADATRAVQNIGDLRGAASEAGAWVASEGVLCGEPVRGVRLSIADAVLHADAAHRSAAQLVPAVRRAMHAALLAAEPRLAEPVYACEVTVPAAGAAACASAVRGVLQQRRGRVVDEGPAGAALYVLRAELPVAESFGLAAALGSATGGQAFAVCQFSHWATVPSDPLDPGSRAGAVVAAIRKRKGLGALPTVGELVDRL